MKKIFLIPIIVGAALLTAGAVVLGVGLATAKGEETITTPYEFNEEITNFDFDLATANLEFKVSEDMKKKVIVEETEKEKHNVSLENGTLKIIHQNNPKKWFEFVFNWNFKRTITVYLPSGTYGELNHKGSTGDLLIPSDFSFNNVTLKQSTGDIDFKCNVANELKIDVSTGNVNLNGVKAKSVNLVGSTGNYTLDNVEIEEGIVSDQSTGKFTLKNSKCKNLNVKTSTGEQLYEKVDVEEKMTLKASTGDITLNGVNCKNYESNTSTGDVALNETIVVEHIKIETGTGDVDFYNSDAETLNIKTDTGHVKGNLLTDHIFYVESDTGTPRVPKSTTGGLCEIKTDTGKIDITVGAK